MSILNILCTHLCFRDKQGLIIDIRICFDHSSNELTLVEASLQKARFGSAFSGLQEQYPI